jgi:hypothetical protein
MSRIGSGGLGPVSLLEMWQPGGTPAAALLMGRNVIAN